MRRQPYTRLKQQRALNEADSLVPREEPVLVQVCNFLNHLLTVDPQAITDLWKQRVPCNQALAAHKTVQVRQVTNDDFSVSFLGILNGLSWDSYVAIGAVYDDELDLITRFTIMRTDGSPL